jgi:hypothetical protein
VKHTRISPYKRRLVNAAGGCCAVCLLLHKAFDGKGKKTSHEAQRCEDDCNECEGRCGKPTIRLFRVSSIVMRFSYPPSCVRALSTSRQPFN